MSLFLVELLKKVDLKPMSLEHIVWKLQANIYREVVGEEGAAPSVYRNQLKFRKFCLV